MITRYFNINKGGKSEICFRGRINCSYVAEFNSFVQHKLQFVAVFSNFVAGQTDAVSGFTKFSLKVFYVCMNKIYLKLSINKN